MEAGKETSTAPDTRKSRRPSVRSASCRIGISIRKMYTDAIGPDGIHHGSAKVTITRELPHRVNGHYFLNYVYTSLKKEILNALVVTDSR